MSLDDKQILVIGGTGFLGQPVVQILDHFGFPVRVMTRDIKKARQVFGEHYDIVKGDVDNKNSLAKAMDGCYGVHINLKGNHTDSSFDRIEHQGTLRIVKVAQENKVRRLTYISGASVSKDRINYPGTRAKYQAEQAIVNSGLEYAIFRASWFMESLLLFLRGKQATIMGKDCQKIHWIAASDYARMVTQAFLLDDPPNNIFTIFGPEAYTFREALEIYTRNVDPDIKIKTIPLGILKFFAAITFSQPLKNILPFIKYFEENGELGDPTEADELLGTPQTTLEKWCADIKQEFKQN